MAKLFKKKKKEEYEELSSFIPQELLENKELSLRDVIAPSALKVNSESVQIGQKLAKTFFVVSYPRFLSKGWFSPIINLSQEFDIAIFVGPIETQQALRKFRRKVAQVESQISERESKGLVRDPKLDTAFQDLEDLRTKLQQATEKLFEVGVYITIYGTSEEEIKKVENKMKSLLESSLIFIKPALFQQEEGFRSTIPLGKDLLRVYSKLNSSPLSSIFPFVSFNLSAEDGILYGINRHNSSLVLFDRFSLPNYNSVTFATSGAGKSYALKLEAIRSLMIGIDVIVIDPEREFEELAKAVGGRYFNISLNSEHHINPFDIPAPLEDENPADVLRANIISLVGFFRLILEVKSQEEDSILDKAITETYALKDITPSSDLKNVEAPLISDFELVLKSIEGSESLIQRLSKFSTGSWANFINSPTNIDLTKKMVVFSIRDMEESLRPAAMHMITRFVWNSVRRELKRRLLIVDEAWIMMKSEDSASFLYGMVKRGRKYYLGVATITQDVSDFLKSDYGQPIITNSSIVLLLKQSPTTMDQIQKVFNLTNEEKFLLLEASVGEGIFIAGLKRVAIKVVASFTEDKIITSDPAELLKQQNSDASK